MRALLCDQDNFEAMIGELHKALNVSTAPLEKPMRTMTQIFTGRGAGRGTRALV
jgi:ATP:corrinoid adenosyltransferase